MRALVMAGLLAATILPALAQDEPAYLDDRSTAESVVRSFYNAIDRKEYARAYSYFRDGEGVDDYATFAKGYADTTSVTVTTGEATSDGAAGSIYYALPVSLDALGNDGRHRYFAGCYTLRLIQPSVQEPPVVPMHIVKGTLRDAKGAGTDYLPKSCD